MTTSVRDEMNTPEWALEVVYSRARELAETTYDLEIRLGDAVRHARATGATWEQIGTMLNTTKQAAQQRFQS
jgi:hypothetical protein